MDVRSYGREARRPLSSGDERGRRGTTVPSARETRGGDYQLATFRRLKPSLVVVPEVLDTTAFMAWVPEALGLLAR
jgi:hypothetical protein